MHGRLTHCLRGVQLHPGPSSRVHISHEPTTLRCADLHMHRTSLASLMSHSGVVAAIKLEGGPAVVFKPPSLSTLDGELRLTEHVGPFLFQASVV